MQFQIVFILFVEFQIIIVHDKTLEHEIQRTSKQKISYLKFKWCQRCLLADNSID